MKESKLTLHIQMPTEMSDIPSINVYDGDNLIAVHTMVYAEDLYCAIIGRLNFYDEITRAIYEGGKNKMKLLVKLLYAIDNGMLILYYKTRIKLFESIGAYVGGLGNKLNKESK